MASVLEIELSGVLRLWRRFFHLCKAVLCVNYCDTCFGEGFGKCER